MSECVKRQGCHPLTDVAHGLVTGADKAKLFERLCQRQAIRREIGVRPLNIPVLYKRKKRMIAESRYDEIMKPYVDAAFRKIDWPDSPTGRILLAVKTYRACAAQCERETGYANPRHSTPDIFKLMDQFVAPLA